MAKPRDPVSVAFDRAAAHVLSKAIAAKGEWFGTRVADPTARQLARWRMQGIDPMGPDNTSARGGRSRATNARTRWMRGFVRSVYYINDRRQGGPGRPLEIQVGRAMPVRGVVPAGRAVRVRVRRGGSAAINAARRKSQGERIWADDDATPGARFSDPSLRDW